MPDYEAPSEADFKPRELKTVIAGATKRTSSWADWPAPAVPGTLRSSPLFLFKNVPWDMAGGIMHRDVWITTEIDGDMTDAASDLRMSMQPGQHDISGDMFTTTGIDKCGGQPTAFLLDPYDPDMGANPIDPTRAGNKQQYLVAISPRTFLDVRRSILAASPDSRELPDGRTFDPQEDVLFNFARHPAGMTIWDEGCLPRRHFALRVNLDIEFSRIDATPLDLKLWSEDTCQNAVFGPRYPEIPVTEANPHGNAVPFPLLTTTHKVRAMPALTLSSALDEVCKFHNGGENPNTTPGSGFVVGPDGFVRGAYCSQRAGVRAGNHFADPFIIQTDDGDITQEDESKWGLQGQVPAGFCGFVGGYEAPVWTEVEFWSEQHICGGWI